MRKGSGWLRDALKNAVSFPNAIDSTKTSVSRTNLLSIEGNDDLYEREEPKVNKCIIFLVFFILFVDTLSSSIAAPVLPFIVKEFGGGPFRVGCLYSGSALMAFLAGPVVALASDGTLGRKPILLASLFGSCIATIAQGWAWNYEVLFIGRAFGGIWGAVWMTVSAYFIDVIPSEMTRYYLGYLPSVAGIATVIGPGIGGCLAQYGLQIPFRVGAAVTFFTGLVVMVYVPESKHFQVAVDEKKVKEHVGMRSYLSIPVQVYLVGIASFMNSLAKSTVNSMLAVSAYLQFQMDPPQVGRILVCAAVVEIANVSFCVQPLVSALKRWQKSNTTRALFAVCILGFAASTAGLLALGLSSTWYLFMAALMMYRIGQSYLNATCDSVLVGFMREDNKSTVLAIQNFFSTAGKLIAPITMGHIAKHRLYLLWPLASSASFGGLLITLGVWFCHHQ